MKERGVVGWEVLQWVRVGLITNQYARCRCPTAMCTVNDDVLRRGSASMGPQSAQNVGAPSVATTPCAIHAVPQYHAEGRRGSCSSFIDPRRKIHVPVEELIAIQLKILKETSSGKRCHPCKTWGECSAQQPSLLLAAAKQRGIQDINGTFHWKKLGPWMDKYCRQQQPALEDANMSEPPVPPGGVERSLNVESDGPPAVSCSIQTAMDEHCTQQQAALEDTNVSEPPVSSGGPEQSLNLEKSSPPTVSCSTPIGWHEKRKFIKQHEGRYYGYILGGTVYNGFIETVRAAHVNALVNNHKMKFGIEEFYQCMTEENFCLRDPPKRNAKVVANFKMACTERDASTPRGKKRARDYPCVGQLSKKSRTPPAKLQYVSSFSTLVQRQDFVGASDLVNYPLNGLAYSANLAYSSTASEQLPLNKKATELAGFEIRGNAVVHPSVRIGKKYQADIPPMNLSEKEVYDAPMQISFACRESKGPNTNDREVPAATRLAANIRDPTESLTNLNTPITSHAGDAETKIEGQIDLSSQERKLSEELSVSDKHDHVQPTVIDLTMDDEEEGETRSTRSTLFL